MEGDQGRREVNPAAIRNTWNRAQAGGNIEQVCADMNKMLLEGDPMSPSSLASDSDYYEDEATTTTTTTPNKDKSQRRRHPFPIAPPPRAIYQSSPLASPTPSLIKPSTIPQPFPILKAASSLPEDVVRLAVKDVLHRNSRDVTLRSLRLQLQNALGADFSSKKAENMLKRIVAEEKGEVPDAKQQSFLQEMEQARKVAREKRKASKAAAAAAAAEKERKDQMKRSLKEPPPSVAVAAPASSLPAHIRSLAQRNKLGLLTNVEQLRLNEHIAEQSQKIVRGFLGRIKYLKAKQQAEQLVKEQAERFAKEQAEQLVKERAEQVALAKAAQQLKVKEEEEAKAEERRQQLVIFQKKTASIDIQRVFRGWNKRRYYIELMKMKRRRKRNRSATKIQNRIRIILSKTIVETERKRRFSIVSFQCHIRRKLATIRMNQMKDERTLLWIQKSIQIQTIVRQYNAKKRTNKMKRRREEQERKRKKKQLEDEMKLKRVIFIQTFFRCQIKRKKYLLLRKSEKEKEEEENKRRIKETNKKRDLALIILQENIRCLTKRRRYKQQQHLATKLQKMYKQWKRKKNKKMKMMIEKKRIDKKKEQNILQLRLSNRFNHKNKTTKKKKPETLLPSIQKNLQIYKPKPKNVQLYKTQTQNVKQTKINVVDSKRRKNRVGRLRTSGWDDEVLSKQTSSNKSSPAIMSKSPILRSRSKSAASTADTCRMSQNESQN